MDWRSSFIFIFMFCRLFMFCGAFMLLDVLSDVLLGCFDFFPPYFFSLLPFCPLLPRLVLEINTSLLSIAHRARFRPRFALALTFLTHLGRPRPLMIHPLQMIHLPVHSMDSKNPCIINSARPPLLFDRLMPIACIRARSNGYLRFMQPS
jgi:hypothetical protein